MTEGEDRVAGREPEAAAEAAAEAAEPGPPPGLDLRVGEVVDAGAHPNADRLLLLRVDLGSETRQLVAGLAGVYEPADLVGRRIVVVANLRPARLRGEVSEGMLLAAHGEGAVGLLLAPEAAPGTRLDGSSADSGQITIDDFGAHEIRAAPEGVTLDGRRIDAPRLVVDRDAWGPVR
jgi:methionine--tRNA ligase beta chain